MLTRYRPRTFALELLMIFVALCSPIRSMCWST